MISIQRIFGSGPVDFFISLVLLLVSILSQNYFHTPQITTSDFLRYTIFVGMSMISVLIIVRSMKSLPPTARGVKLITTGVFKYFRHPLYGSILSFFNFGLTFLLNICIYIFWAVARDPIWHWIIGGEEKLMEKEIPG